MDMFFEGHIDIDKPLKHWEIFYLKRFIGIRHMKRNVYKIDDNHWLLKLMKLPKGADGEFFVPLPKPGVHCTLENYKDFLPSFQKVIITLFCIHRFHYYKQLDKNVFIILANELIKCSIMEYENVMTSYSKFEQTLKVKISDNMHDESRNSYDHRHYRTCPGTQPSLYCQWDIVDEGTKIEHDQDIKFKDIKFINFTEWLIYLIKNFFKPWGYTLNGRINYQSEDVRNYGYITVTDNVVEQDPNLRIHGNGNSCSDEDGDDDGYNHQEW